MTFEEKTAWVYGVVSLAGYIVYLTILGTLVGEGTPLHQVNYIPPMLWTIGGSIAISILATIGVGMVTPRGKDQRDREIYRFGEYVGNSFIVIGAVTALILALLAVSPFWIANALYLCFTLSALLGTIAKLVAYHRGIPQKW